MSSLQSPNNDEDLVVATIRIYENNVHEYQNFKHKNASFTLDYKLFNHSAYLFFGFRLMDCNQI